MRRIEIDEEVYKALAERAVGFQQPNDVLHGVLDLDQADPGATAATAPGRQGRLVPLLTAGVLAPGDKLVHVQTRKGLSCVGQVDADGWITTEHGRYAQPSPALRDLVGSQIDGWAYWTHERSSKSLRQLREEIGGKPRGQR
jgi:hypothetical protein